MAIGKKTGGKDFVKGNVPKSPGRPPLSPEAKKLRKLTTEEFVKRVNKYLHMSKNKLRAGITNGNIQVLDLCIRSSLVKCIEKGDYSTLEKMLDRIIGKVAMKLEHTGKDGEPIEISDAREKLLSRFNSLASAKEAGKVDKQS